MKKLKIAAELGALTLLCGCMDVSDYLKNEIEPPVRPVPNSMPGNIDEVRDELNDAEWYHELCNSILDGNEVTYVSEHVSNSDVKMALSMIITEHPEISWLGNMYSASTATDGSKVNIDFKKDFDADDIPATLEKLDKAADEIIKDMPKDGSDYDKVLYVHDCIAESTTYDHAAAESSSLGISGTAYGCLVEGKSVCSGYAAAFQYIMQKIGMESGICTGSNHAWNYVKVDGEYYWLDITWDDHDIGRPEHTFFLFTTDQLLNTRSFELTQYYIPECTASENNYFVKNGGYFDEADEDKMIDYISGCADTGQCEMMFGNFEAYSEALDLLIARGKFRKADGVPNGEVSYYRNDDMFTLEFIF